MQGAQPRRGSPAQTETQSWTRVRGEIEATYFKILKLNHVSFSLDRPQFAWIRIL